MGKRKIYIYSIVFIASIFVTSIFLLALPKQWAVNESSDYIDLYEPIARNIVNGKGYIISNNSIATSCPPGYPIILATQYLISETYSIPERFTLNIFIVVLTAISVLTIFHLSWKFTDLKSAIIIAILWMTYPFLLWLTKQPNSEIVFMAVLYYGCSIIFSFSCFQRIPKIPYLISGLVIGISILIRPIAIFFPVALAFSIIYSLSNLSFKDVTLSLVLFLIGVLLPIIPWELYVYKNTGQIIPISTNSTVTLLDGLLYAVNDQPYKQPVAVPLDVRDLMMEIKSNYQYFTSTNKVFFFLGTKINNTPLVVFELFLIKALRSWYATDSQRLEFYIFFCRYLMFCLF